MVHPLVKVVNGVRMNDANFTYNTPINFLTQSLYLLIVVVIVRCQP